MTTLPTALESSAPTLFVLDLGHIDYQRAFRFQECIRDVILYSKKLHEKGHISHLAPNCILLCTHPHVYTMGKRSHPKHLLFDAAQMRKQGVQVCATNRGGQVTYHGPGQLVVYPILDMRPLFLDVARYMRFLEEIVIKVLKDFSLLGTRIEGATGVWVKQGQETAYKKICAIGVRISRWITTHGLALNIDPDLRFFDRIVACGLPESKATSMVAASSNPHNIAVSAVTKSMVRHFSQSLEQPYTTLTARAVEQLLAHAQASYNAFDQILEVLYRPR